MRTLETAAVLIYVIYVLILLAPSQRRGRLHAWIGIAAGIVAVAQAAIEGYRWQMLPLDVVIAITAILSLLSLLKRTTSPSPRRFAFRIGQTALGLLLAVLVAAPAMLFPVPVLPAPTGPYPVGTLSFALTDASRIDPYAPNPGTPRELLARVWYPAQTTAAPNAPWVSGIERITGAFARSGGLPSFFFSHLVYARAHSVQDAPLAAVEPQYPVLHFSHGLGGITSQDTFLVEELASRGYIVVSTLHPYAALDAVFPDGHIVPYNPAVLPKDTKSEEYTRAALRLGRQWTDDTIFVQNALEHLTATQPGASAANILAGHMDFTRIGAFGHSTGGGSTIQFCAEDARCKAAIGLDPWVGPVSDEVIAKGLTQPALFLFSDPALAFFAPANRARFLHLVPHLATPENDFYIAGAGHHDFDDTATFTPIALLFGYSKGPIAAQRAFDIVRAMTVAFFDNTLRGTAAPLPQFPEVKRSTQ